MASCVALSALTCKLLLLYLLRLTDRSENSLRFSQVLQLWRLRTMTLNEELITEKSLSEESIWNPTHLK